MGLTWRVNLIVPEYETYDGIKVEGQKEVHRIPFEYRQTVWYAHHKDWTNKKSKWVITKSKIAGVWATNCVGVILDNNEHVSKDNFNRLFTDPEAAIEFVLKKNEQRKVKIYES